ncbi:MAG: methyltransferase domain-containing protein [Planctomycetes bacterium]|nr:methyltransferase domain-containing protein [Planctomycetota bacterium]
MINRNARTFLKTYVRSPSITGAIAPSSRGLARALTAPLREYRTPARVLEVGAGTGAVTRVIGECLGSEDRLDVCEIQTELADILDAGVLAEGALAGARDDGRVRLIRSPVQDIEADNTYDFVISGLPFTAFQLEDAREILNVIRASLKPEGVFSYFEYIALRYFSRTFGFKATRQRVKAVSSLMDELILTHQIGRQAVLFNIPPAYARHLVFSGSEC